MKLKEGEVLAQSQSLSALQDQVQAALRAAHSTPDNECYVWIRDLFPTKVVYSLEGKLYQRDWSVIDNEVKLGDAVEVEVAYKVIGESARAMCREAVDLREAAYDKKTGTLTLTVIESGFNKSKSRYYPASTLKRDHGVFKGAKMFANHQTEEESRKRPEGDVNNWVANLTECWVEKDGRVRGKAVVHDPTFKAKLENLSEASLLGEMGVSIRAIGQGTPAEVEGVQTSWVERFIAARSVDFVTYPGAGGRVEAIESDRGDENDVDLVTEAQLRQRRPDLIALIESNPQEGTLKTLEQQLQESNDALKAAQKQLADANAKLEEADRSQKKAAAATELNKLLSESRLPEAAQKRIRTQFAEADKTDGMKEAIEAEREYIKSFAPGAKVTNLGGKDNGNVEESAKGTPATEKSTKLEEAFSRMPGLSAEEAKIAARGRR